MAARAMTGSASGRRENRRRLLAVTLAVVAFAAVAAVAWPGVQHFLEAPPSEDFSLVALEVKGLRLLNGDDILAASGLAVGDNIFHVDLNAVALRLDSLVWVRRARMERFSASMQRGSCYRATDWRARSARISICPCSGEA
jgi:cell division septal protein FtsQ